MIGAEHASPRRLTTPLLLLVLLCAFSFGAIVRIAFAVSYHTTCVGHGFVHGNSLTDGSFYGRVEPGCGSTLRTCNLYSSGSFIGGQVVTGSTATCTAWSRDFGDFTECASTTHVESSGVFSDHVHLASNWCG
ncbi:MAG: hypothetical protein QOH83_1892 [Solirubrobacteraceae bacterium]|jgi:hypothetical protein|nr:hypothetical protein [Solirubrobacteraceae bacterium]